MSNRIAIFNALHVKESAVRVVAVFGVLRDDVIRIKEKSMHHDEDRSVGSQLACRARKLRREIVLKQRRTLEPTRTTLIRQLFEFSFARSLAVGFVNQRAIALWCKQARSITRKTDDAHA
jgi:hypothetical protein